MTFLVSLMFIILWNFNTEEGISQLVFGQAKGSEYKTQQVILHQQEDNLSNISHHILKYQYKYHKHYSTCYFGN